MQPHLKQPTFRRSSHLTLSPRGVALYGAALLAPFLFAVLSLLHPRDPASRNVIWIFVIFYGAVFYIAAGSSADSVRYSEWLEEMHRTGLGLQELASLFFAEGSKYQDIYQPLLTFIVSLLTDKYWVLFSAFGVLFGYAYTRNIWFLIDRISGRLTPLLIFLLAAYAFHVNVGSGLNGVRMWTALHVFLFGLLNLLSTGKWKFALIIFLTPLIHFSFWLACGVAVGYLFIRRFGLGVYLFYLISFIGAAPDFVPVQSLMEYLPMPIEGRASSYILAAEANPSIMEESRASTIWFLQLNNLLLSAFCLLSASWMVWRGCLQRDGIVRSLLVFGMLMYGVINLVSYIPSLGRFYNLAELLILASLILFLASSTRQNRLDRQVFTGAAMLLSINLALGVRFMMVFSSIWLVAGNFLVAPFVEADMSLYEVVFRSLRTVFGTLVDLFRSLI